MSNEKKLSRSRALAAKVVYAGFTIMRDIMSRIEQEVGLYRNNMKKNQQKMREEIGDEVFDGIPPDNKRRTMSPRDLAKLLLDCEKNTPKYILVEHELNLRIANTQARATLIASVISGLVGAIAGSIFALIVG